MVTGKTIKIWFNHYKRLESYKVECIDGKDQSIYTKNHFWSACMGLDKKKDILKTIDYFSLLFS